MHYNTRSFVGRSTPGFWAQYWENEPDDRQLADSHGHLFGLISLTSADTSQDPSLIGHQVISRVNTLYYSSVNSSVSENLSQSLKTAITSIPPSVQISVVLLVVHRQELYFISYHHGSVILRRGQQISRLITGDDNSYLSLQGPLKADDQLFLVTNELVDSFTWDKIKANLFLPKIQDIEESFLNAMYRLEDQRQLAAAHITLCPDEDDLSTAIPKPVSPPPAETLVLPPPLLSVPVPSSPAPPSPPKKKFHLSSVFQKHRHLYVSHDESATLTRRRRLNFLLGLVVFLGLVGVTIYGYRLNQQKQTEAKYRQLEAKLTEQINSAKAVVNLDLNAALDQAKSAKGILSQMSDLKIHSADINRYQDQISSLLSQTGSSDNFTPAVLYDTSLIRQNPAYSEMIISKDTLYLLDSSAGRIDKVNPSKKSTSLVAEYPALKSASSLADNSGLLYVINDKKISLVDKKDLTSKVDLSATIKDFSAGQIGFWNGALYLLTIADTPNFYKFTPNSSGFGSPSAWLKDSTNLPSKPSSFAINGSVWIIGQDGNLIPYTRGVPDKFTQAKASITHAKHLVTSPDSELIAFTDDDSQVYVYRKTGQSAARYNLGSKKILSLTLDDTNNQLLLLCSDQKIYKIGL